MLILVWLLESISLLRQCGDSCFPILVRFLPDPQRLSAPFVPFGDSGKTKMHCINPEKRVGSLRLILVLPIPSRPSRPRLGGLSNS